MSGRVRKGERMQLPRKKKRRVQILRENLNMSQNELAFEARVSTALASYIERPENGNIVSRYTFEQIAKVLGVEADWLMEDQLKREVSICECCGQKVKTLVLDGEPVEPRKERG